MLIEPTKQKLHSGEGKVSSRSGYFHKVSLWDQLEKCCKNYDNLFYKGVPIQLGGTTHYLDQEVLTLLVFVFCIVVHRGYFLMLPANRDAIEGHDLQRSNMSKDSF